MSFSTATIVHYNVKLPNRLALRVLSGAGIVLGIVGLVLTIIGVIQVRSYEYSFVLSLDNQSRLFYHYAEPPPTIQWGHGLVVAVTGVVMFLVFSAVFNHYYRVVRQGRVVGKSTRDGLYGLGWYVTIEGNTYANERRRYTIPVNAGFWQGATTQTRVYDI
jgi:hypothetical protein